MVEGKERTKTDPKDAKILVLTTRLSKLDGVNNSSQLTINTNQLTGCGHYNGKGNGSNKSYAESLYNIGLIPAQDGPFFYTHSHLSALQNCALLFSINFQFTFILKKCIT